MPKRGSLSEQEMRFVMEYIEDNNATRAYMDAGYKYSTYDVARTLASRLLTKVHIKDAIRQEKDKVMKRLHITKGRVLRELAKIAYANIEDVVKWDNSGVHYSSSAELPRDITAAVAEVQETVTNQGHTLKFKMHDKAKALIALIEKLEEADKDNEKSLLIYDDPKDPT